MDIGLTIPTRGPLATPEGIEALVRRAEELGFAHLSVSDHVVVPRAIDSRYPYSETGEWPGGEWPGGRTHERVSAKRASGRAARRASGRAVGRTSGCPPSWEVPVREPGGWLPSSGESLAMLGGPRT